jgi:NitT/TauT family transport system substrate-binding protein
MQLSRTLRRATALGLVLVLGVTAAACGDDKKDDASTGATGSTTEKPVEVRLGYFPNITHAPALVGIEGGYFEKALGKNTLKTSPFNAGPEAVEALASDALDMSFIGPNPAINAYAKTLDEGGSIRIVSGSTSGGAFLVTKPDILKPADLKGKTLATPQLGNTQDVALRAWLADNGFKTDDAGGGDVSIAPQANADALAAFISGSIDGAWVPEPWATRLIQEGGGHVLVDEATLWPEGQYVTTHLIVRTKFLADHPDVVKEVIEGLADSLDLIESNPIKAKELTNAGITAVTDKPLADPVIAVAWENLHFTLDPISSSLQKSAKDAESVGLLDPVDLKGIYDLKLLNEVLADRGEAAVKGF